MPSGYTADITKETSLRDFATRCARAFGATIDQRDEPASEGLKLPQPSDYHRKAEKKAEQKLKKLKAMKPEQAEAAAAEAFEQATKDYQERIDKRHALKLAYQLLLVKAKHWAPPTAEHQELKKFMIEQLESSIDFDCNGRWDKAPKQQAGPVWLAERIEAAQADIKYHREKQQEEEERTAERAGWITALLDSLPLPSPRTAA
ncbi:hypothetical protein LJY25_14665 [Hymenobacter sp. BT175]|uniref:hypothetical protein n=1 Tax=Hymenobacter translucens TaxID=2886507 RepID=UPI001D0E9BEC|nr:hypothetical protein [Hymenobacter translucens]MCC2547695.1 hypothetical protein [Hymenobacter translucens]